MNLTEQIKVFDSFDIKLKTKYSTLGNMQNIKAISRLLKEADKQIYFNNEMNNNLKSRKVDSLHEYKLNDRVKLPSILSKVKNKENVQVHFQDDVIKQKKKLHRINLFGYDSIQEETYPIVRRISPKEKEPKNITKQQMEQMIKKPSLKSLKLNSDKKGILFNDSTMIKENTEKPAPTTPPISKEETEKNRDSKMTFSSSLSEDANYAMLKTYEDMLYLDLLSIFPESENLSRTKTKDFIQIPRKIPVKKLPPINSSKIDESGEENRSEKKSEIKSHQIKISQHLEKVNFKKIFK